jgi:hypothetical protein
MGALRGFVLRTLIIWVLSLIVSLAGMEAGHRFVVARDRGRAAPWEPAQAPTTAEAR